MGKYFASKIPSFYLEILEAWYCFRNREQIENINSDNQILWFNKYVTIDNTPLFYKGWYDRNIVHFNDICFEGHFKPLEMLKENIHVKTTK